MISQLVNGTLVNLDVCEDAGVDPFAIYDWTDFTEVVRNQGCWLYPIATAANNAGTLANYAGTENTMKVRDLMTLTRCLTEPMTGRPSNRASGPISLTGMSKDFYAEDVQTVADSDLQERFANNEIAFFLGNDPSWLINAKALNEEGNFGFLPSFASTKEGVQFCGVVKVHIRYLERQRQC
jgi:raffinose/stachyose/melibiose transport system substrate-binding protein